MTHTNHCILFEALLNRAGCVHSELQIREEHWVVADLIGEAEARANGSDAEPGEMRGRWLEAGCRNHDQFIFRAVSRTGAIWGEHITPEALDISTGQVVDSHGGISRQMDVIISDTAKTPILYQTDETRVVPIECVYASVEVKASLTLGDVDTVFQNMQSVKQLKKTAFLPENGNITRSVDMYGQNWAIWPVNYYVFAFGGVDLTSIAQRLQQLTIEAAAPAASRVDMVCILDRGVICNRTSDGLFDALPTPTSNLFVCNTAKSLLLFYTLATRYFNQVWLPSFRFKDYLGAMTFD